MNSQIGKIQNFSVKHNQSPVFVVGYMHSGTTLLINILRSHSSVFSGKGESKYFMHLPMIKRNYPNLDDEHSLHDFVLYVITGVMKGFGLVNSNNKGNNEFRLSWLGNDEKRLENLLADARKIRKHEAMFSLVSDHLTQAMNKMRWVEKTPTHIFHIDEIIRYVPDALFVEIVRDPRDILASKKTRKFNVWNSDKYPQAERLRKHWEKAYDPLWDSLSWKSAICAGKLAREKYQDRIFTIKYEDLVNNPEKQTHKICAFLKMEFELEMLNISNSNSAEKNKKSTQSGIVNTSIGRWQNTLNSQEVATCQWIIGKEMDDLGYKKSKVLTKDKMIVPVIFAKSMFEFLQRSIGRWRLGGWLFFQNVFINYWKRLRVLLFRS